MQSIDNDLAPGPAVACLGVGMHRCRQPALLRLFGQLMPSAPPSIVYDVGDPRSLTTLFKGRVELKADGRSGACSTERQKYSSSGVIVRYRARLENCVASIG